MPRKPMKVKPVRVDEETWAAALAAAERRHEVLSQEMRRFLREYAKPRPDEE